MGFRRPAEGRLRRRREGGRPSGAKTPRTGIVKVFSAVAEGPRRPDRGPGLPGVPIAPVRFRSLDEPPYPTIWSRGMAPAAQSIRVLIMDGSLAQSRIGEVKSSDISMGYGVLSVDPEGDSVYAETMRAESREPRAESREPRAESREPRAESREPRAESREPRAESREPRAESREPRAESREPRAESREPRAESREPRAESREPRAESREPRAESREPRAESFVMFAVALDAPASAHRLPARLPA